MVYDDMSAHVVLMKDTQIGGTTWAALRSLHACLCGLIVVYHFPTRTEVHDFSRSRVAPLVEVILEKPASGLTAQRVWTPSAALVPTPRRGCTPAGSGSKSPKAPFTIPRNAQNRRHLPAFLPGQCDP